MRFRLSYINRDMTELPIDTLGVIFREICIEQGIPIVSLYVGELDNKALLLKDSIWASVNDFIEEHDVKNIYAFYVEKTNNSITFKGEYGAR